MFTVFLIVTGIVMMAYYRPLNCDSAVDQGGVKQGILTDQTMVKYEIVLKTPDSKDSADVINVPEKGAGRNAFPEVFKGTRPDGELISDDEGNLVILPSIRRRFEYYYSAISEAGPEWVRSQIEKDIRENLPEKASNQALTILHGYLDYKAALSDMSDAEIRIPETINHVEELREVIVFREALRRQHLSPDVVSAFFGKEEEYDELSLQLLELHFNQDLNDTEKQSKMADLRKKFNESGG